MPKLRKKKGLNEKDKIQGVMQFSRGVPSQDAGACDQARPVKPATESSEVTVPDVVTDSSRMSVAISSELPPPLRASSVAAMTSTEARSEASYVDTSRVVQTAWVATASGDRSRGGP